MAAHLMQQKQAGHLQGSGHSLGTLRYIHMKGKKPISWAKKTMRDLYLYNSAHSNDSQYTFNLQLP